MPIQTTPRTAPLSDQVGACLGCRDCRGTCRALADLLTVPGIVLR